MKGIPHRNRLVAASNGSGEFQSHADRRGAAGSEKDFFQISGRQLRQFLRQLDGWNIGVPARAERKLIELLFDGSDHARIAKADLVNVVAMEIHVPSPLQVFDI